MALIYFDPYPKIPIIKLSILKMYLSLIFLGGISNRMDDTYLCLLDRSVAFVQ